MYQFTSLTEEEFENFAFSHKYGSFHQTISWGKLKEQTGWIPYLYGVKEDNVVVAASLILKKPLFLSYSLFYSPRGFLIDYNNKELLNFFVTELKLVVKEEKGILIKIDPSVDLYKRDISGNIIDSENNNMTVVENLKELKFKHYGFNKHMETLQPRWFFYLDLKDKSEEEIFNNMETTTKQLVRKNVRNGLKTREIKPNELIKFKRIMEHTAKRRGFIDRPYSYYESMMNLFKEDCKIVITEINMDIYLANVEKDLEENLILKKKKEEELKNPSTNLERIKKALIEATNSVNRLEKKKSDALDIISKEGKTVVLGGMLFLIHNKEILSLFGGAYQEYMDFYPSYTFNWDMIKWGIDNKFDVYNFYGITGIFDPKDKDYGLYNFKKGYGGAVGEYIGEFDLIVNPFMNHLYNFALKVYNLVKKITRR